MHRFYSLAAILALVAFGGADWLEFRGAANRGFGSGKLPADLSKEKNIVWTADLPGRGVSSPIVVGGRVIVTANSGPRQERLHVLAFDAASGREVWHRQFWATGRTLTHPVGANAAPTPASDGKRIFAFYSSNDLIALDLDGNLLWFRGLGHDYPKAGNDIGMSASPTVIGDTVVVQVENQGDSFAAGIDVESGENRWRIARDPGMNWASPTSVPPKDGSPGLVLLQSPGALSAHDPKTGAVLWTYKATCADIASVVAVGDNIFVPAAGLTSLKASGTSQPEVVWQSAQISPSRLSPIVHDDKVYIVNSSGVLVSGDTKTGDVVWQQRLTGKFWASPVLADGKVFIANDAGLLQVADTAQEGKIISTLDLGEGIYGSPAVADGGLFIRSSKHLWKIGEKP